MAKTEANLDRWDRMINRARSYKWGTMEPGLTVDEAEIIVAEVRRLRKESPTQDATPTTRCGQILDLRSLPSDNRRCIRHFGHVGKHRWLMRDGSTIESAASVGDGTR